MIQFSKPIIENLKAFLIQLFDPFDRFEEKIEGMRHQV